jgi:hypothetical protein
MKRALLTLALSLAALPAMAQVTLVDVIPLSMSNETNHDTETFFAFNPANPNVLIATAFTPADALSTNGPIFVSMDGGANWSRADIVPTCMGCFNTGDLTLGFSASGALYAGVLSHVGFTMQVLRTTDPTLTTPFTSLTGHNGPDQPFLFARTVFGWFDPGLERVYVGNNFGASGTSAKVDQTLDAVASVFTTETLDTGVPLRDNYQIRPVVHADGTTYAAYIRRNVATATGYDVDIKVTRDNFWAKTAPRYQDLGAGGSTVASVPITIDFSGTFGGERIGGDLFLTVDPVNSQRPYISYASREASDPMTLHLRRSIDGGTSWQPDMLTIPSAKNGAIAVNVRGQIAYLYQQLTATNHWVTHLRRSSTDGASFDDTTLSDFTEAGVVSGCPCPFVGDYDMMLAVGKNFYGTFAALNDPATFPAGISYLRNHSAATPPVLEKADNTPVGLSIDPIFFRTTEIAADADVYVRDWTDSASVHDHGLEPSARANFFSTSDVWNERLDDPAGFNASDQPLSHDPQPMAVGHNWAFSRVSREATGTMQHVTLDYLFSDGGVGVNFVDAGMTSIDLAAGDSSAFPPAGSGFQWDLPSGASNHVCLAVQISTAGDAYIAPTLDGRAPGWPSTDLDVINDNNKAQRNLQVFGFGGMAHGDMSMYAIAHNAATFTRDMQIGIDVGEEGIAELLRPRIHVIGGPDPVPEQTIKGRTSITLARMRPGENRWIEIRAAAADAGKRDLPIRIFELLGPKALNGYELVFRPASLDEVIAQNVFQHAAVFHRLGAMGNADARRRAEEAARLIKQPNVSADLYMKLVRASLGAVEKQLELFRRDQIADSFDVAGAARALASMPNEPSSFAVADASLLNRLDALATFAQKSKGDAADVKQTVRWQAELFRRKGAGSNKLRGLATEFLSRPDGYASLIGRSIPLLRDFARTTNDAVLIDRVAALEKAAGVEAMQHAHREVLLRVEEKQ